MTNPIPTVLLKGPFTRAEAIDAGATARMLRGNGFIRLFPRVWVHRDFVMSDRDWIAAAQMALPAGARVSHATRLRLLGLEDGPLRPFHFTVVGDLHLDLPDITLHRTVVMPPCDAVGVTPEAAYLGVAATGRLIDLIKIGDWLLYNEVATMESLLETARLHAWRPGSGAVFAAARHLDGRSRSLKESETRAVLGFAGLPECEVNFDIIERGRFLARGDLVYVAWRLIVEYEGRQHAQCPAQFNTDIGRYGGLRGDNWDYVQVTNEKLNNPRRLVAEVYNRLVARGYTGPPPVFGRHWRSLFRSVPRPRKSVS